MNEAAPVAQPQGQIPPVVEDQPDGASSIAEHASQFGPPTEKADPERSAEDLKPIRPVDQQKRDQGKFVEGHRPLKAKDAVGRINELTARAKSAEERAAKLDQDLAQARRELATARTPAQVERAEAKIEKAEAKVEATAGAAFPEPEPQEHDAKYEGDYGKYLRACAAWEGRKATWEHRQADQQARVQAQQEEAHRTALRTWGERVKAAQAKHTDFADVAFAPTRILAGSPIDAFIMEDDNGPDVLYYLNHPSHAQELDELLGLPVLQQVKRLSLLSQRFSSTPSGSTGATGAVAGRTPYVPPPKPPTPVRTEAQRASDSPPPTDGSLSIAEHGKAFHARR